MYFQATFMLDLWDDTAEYAIFDDVSWDYFPNKKGFFGAQHNLIVTDKYRKKRAVKWGKPIIYLVNPEDVPERGFGQWFQENAFIIHINHQLY